MPFNIFSGGTSVQSPKMDFSTQTGTLEIIYNPSDTSSPLPADGRTTRTMRVKVGRHNGKLTLFLDE